MIKYRISTQVDNKRFVEKTHFKFKIASKTHKKD